MTSSSPTALSNAKDAALRYIKEFGMCIFILKNNPPDERKKPAVDWKMYQIMRPSPIQIERWFAKNNANYNIAAAMGSVSQMVAFDVDGETAAKWIESRLHLMSEHLQKVLANSYGTLTGGGGKNFIFKIDGDILDISQKILWSDGKKHSQVLLQGNGHYVVVAPSIHPNNNIYQWNGKTPVTITREELDELIRIIQPITATPPSTTITAAAVAGGDVEGTRRLTVDNMNALINLIMPIYQDGSRDHFLLYLSGTMRKDGGFPHEDTSKLVEEISRKSPYADEDLEKNLLIVDRTYRLPPERIRGKAGLKDILIDSYQAKDENEHQQRVEAFSQICQIINCPPIVTVATGGTTSSSTTTNTKEVEVEKANNKSDALGSEVKMLLRRTVDSDDGTKILTWLVNEVMNRTVYKTMYDTAEIWWYDDRPKWHIYRPGGEVMIDTEIEKITKEIGAPYVIRAHTKEEVKRVIRDNTRVLRSDFDANPNVINLENCLLNIETMEQIPHSPDILCMTRHPIWYDPKADCPKIKKFLKEVILDIHKLKETLKFAGYTLIGDCRYEKGLMLLGTGANGKTVFIKVFEAFHGGEQGCSHVSLQELEDDKFARSRLFGKRLNTYADNKSSKMKETGNVKTLISGDSVEGQEKFKPRFSFRNKAKMIISTNNPPETEDKTYAWVRRWLLIDFLRTFISTNDDEERNKREVELINELTSPEEMSGFLNLAVKYCQILVQENGFREEEIDKVLQDYKAKADHVAKWLAANCTIDKAKKDFFTKAGELYEHYVRWCKEMGEMDEDDILEKEVFASKLLERGILHKRKRVKGEGSLWIYDCIKLNHELYNQGQGDLDQTSLDYSNANSQQRTAHELTSNDAILIHTEFKCPHCSLPPFEKKREVQAHILLDHPGLGFENGLEKPTD